MVFLREHKHVAKYSGALERGDILQGVVWMHVVVGSAVHDKERTAQMERPVDCRSVPVAFFVLLRREHESLCVNGVVESPVGDRSDGYCGSVGAVVGRSCHERFVAAETPSVDAYGRAVDIRQVCGPAGGGNLVDGFVMAEILVYGSAECRAASACAASVDTYDDESLRCG